MAAARSRPLRGAAGAAASLAFLVAGCGGDVVPDPAAERLAERSDEVAARLERGATCDAKRAALALRREARRLIAGSTVRGDAAIELRSRTDALVEAIECVPPPAPAPPAATRPVADDEEDRDEHEDDDEDDDGGDDSEDD